MAIMYHHTSSVSVTDTLGRTQPSNFRNYFKSALDFVKCQSSCRDKKTFYSFPFDTYCVKRSLSLAGNNQANCLSSPLQMQRKCRNSIGSAN